MDSPIPSSSETATLSSSSSAAASSSSAASSTSSSDVEPEATANTKCAVCRSTFSQPIVLHCFHTFCRSCLDSVPSSGAGEGLACPTCDATTPLPPGGVTDLLPDYAMANVIDGGGGGSGGIELCVTPATPVAATCTGCKGTESVAVARCVDCANMLCAHCVMAHRFMHCFDGHRVHTLSDPPVENTPSTTMTTLSSTPCCPVHPGTALVFFCRTCDEGACAVCAGQAHSTHDCQPVGVGVADGLLKLASRAKSRAAELRAATNNVEQASKRLQIELQKAQAEINETYNFYRSTLEDRKADALRELDAAYTSRQVALSGSTQQVTDAVSTLHRGADFIERLVRHAAPAQIAAFRRLISTKLDVAIATQADNFAGLDIDFVSNYQAIQVAVRNTFGYIRQHGVDNGRPMIPTPIARPSSSLHSNNSLALINCNDIFDSAAASLLNAKQNFPSNSSLSGSVSGGFVPSASDQLSVVNANGYEKWSSGNDLVFNGGSGNIDIYPLTGNGNVVAPASNSVDPVVDLTTKLITANVYPPKSQLRRQKMIYHCKFGEFGVLEGQFTEPSGVAVTPSGDVVVADTNNHRVQVFDRDGRFRFQFGECGKRDGQLLYPNRVAVSRATGDIVVTERSPTHQVQVYSQYGQFVRKFGAGVLQHPRGVAVDTRGRIIVVECKVMRILVFDALGNVLSKFGCSRHLEFPNGVVASARSDEIFVSDNRAHCVKVFSYAGSFLRQIGGEGVTNYPIGVGICATTGDVLVADNHNNFNLTVFTQDGRLVSALESKVKHAQCFDVALTDDGGVVLASKDYRLYIYRYAQLPAVGKLQR